MSRPRREKHKVINFVVSFVSINMMDVLVGVKGAFQMIFHDQAMLKDIFTRFFIKNDNISFAGFHSSPVFSIKKRFGNITFGPKFFSPYQTQIYFTLPKGNILARGKSLLFNFRKELTLFKRHFFARVSQTNFFLLFFGHDKIFTVMSMNKFIKPIWSRFSNYWQSTSTFAQRKLHIDTDYNGLFASYQGGGLL